LVLGPSRTPGSLNFEDPAFGYALTGYSVLVTKDGGLAWQTGNERRAGLLAAIEPVGGPVAYGSVCTPEGGAL
jgi:photosystem II stability/assembly factor-like uncharacterized protein